MFEQASRMHLRIGTHTGLITVEDLWDIPLTSHSGRLNLDDIAKGLNRELKEKGDEISFVDAKENKDNNELKLAFDIVKHIISIKVAERKLALEVVKRKEQKQLILGLIDQQKNAALAEKTVEELQEMVAAL